MATFIHGIAASQNIDSSGEIVSIAGMDISSLERDGVFNYEHESGKIPDKDGKPVELQIKVPAQVVGKIMKAKKVFGEEDCEDEHQRYFWHKIKTPYLYVMGELFDDYTDAARDLAGKFRYDADKKGINERTINNFSIEGVRIPNSKVDMMVMRSIARKVTITVGPCNKAASAEMIAPAKNNKNDIDSLFKTENVEIELFKGEVNIKKDMGLGEATGALTGVSPASPSLASSELRKDQPKLTVAPPAPKAIGATKSGKPILPNARIHEYKDFSQQDHVDAQTAHINLARHFGAKKDLKQAAFHQGKSLLHSQRARTLGGTAQRQAGTPMKPSLATAPQKTPAPHAPLASKPKKTPALLAPTPPSGKPNTLFDPHMSGKMKPPGPIRKALDAGSALTSAPSELTGGAALGTGFKHKKKKDKSKWLTVAEEVYDSWEKREKFEDFMSKRMPHLTQGEIKAIGQTLALKKSVNLEDALAKMTMPVEPLEKKAGKDSIYTLLLFEGCDLPDVLHCSHFATDDMDGETAKKVKEVCDQYFQGNTASHDLKFDKQGTLGKEDQPVLFLTDGDPYKDLFDKLKEVAEYKYPEFKPHVSVTSNVDSFKGKVAKLVISVNGEVKYTYEIK